MDVTRVHEGELLDLSPRDAGLLLAAEWAIPAEPEQKTEGAGMVRISDLTEPARKWLNDRGDGAELKSSSVVFDDPQSGNAVEYAATG